MKRYNLLAIDNDTGHVIRNYKLMPIECFDGEWVKWDEDDMKDLLLYHRFKDDLAELNEETEREASHETI